MPVPDVRVCRFLDKIFHLRITKELFAGALDHCAFDNVKEKRRGVLGEYLRCRSGSNLTLSPRDYLLFGGLLSRPRPEGLPGCLLGQPPFPRPPLLLPKFSPPVGFTQDPRPEDPHSSS